MTPPQIGSFPRIPQQSGIRIKNNILVISHKKKPLEKKKSLTPDYRFFILHVLK